MTSILDQVGTKVGAHIKSLDLRMTSAEGQLTILGAQVPPPTLFTISPVTWANMTEINIGGEQLLNGSFDRPEIAVGVEVEVLQEWSTGGKTATVGQVYEITLIQSSGAIQLTGNGQTLFCSNSQKLTHIKTLYLYSLNTSYNLPSGDDPPPNGWAWEEIVVDLKVKWVGSSTGNHTQGSVYHANAFRPAWTNYSGNIRITNDSGSYGWAGNNRGTDWEVVQRAPTEWTIKSGSIDESLLQDGIISGANGSVSIQQMFTTPIPIDTELVVKAVRADTNSGTVYVQRLRANGTPYGSNVTIDGSAGFTTTEATYGLRLQTSHGNREVSSVSLNQGAIAGGSVQITTGSIEKISGAVAFNAGASSSQVIGGQQDGHVQFQVESASRAIKVGLVYADEDFDVDAPYFMKFGSGAIDFSTPWIEDHSPFVAGDWFRIRHYSSTNQIHFQKLANIGTENNTLTLETGAYLKFLTNWTAGSDEYRVGDVVQISDMSGSHPQFEGYTGERTLGAGATRGTHYETADYLGQDYVTLYTHPTTTNGGDLKLDVSFSTLGGKINDAQIATVQ